MNIVVLEDCFLDAKAFSIGSGIGEGGLGGFLHHISELSGECELPLSLHDGGLHVKNLAAVLGPGKPCGDAYLVFADSLFVKELWDTEKFVQIGGCYLRFMGMVPLGDLLGHLSADIRDFPLQVPETSLPGVAVNDGQDRLIREFEVIFRDPILFNLPWQEVFSRDFQFFLIRVPGKLKDLHAIPKGRGNGIHEVGCSDKHHLGEIEGNVEIVVAEGVVLFRIENFKKGGGRVSPEIHSDLIDFVHHKDGVFRSRLLDSLDDTAGEGPHVGPPVPADFRFISHASKGDTYKLAAKGPCDRFSKGGFPDTRGARKAEDRALQFLPQLVDAEILQDAFLDLFEVIVILVQDLLCLFDIEVVLGCFFPGKLHHPFQVSPDDRGLRRVGVHLFKAGKLFEGLFLHILRHLRLFDGLFEVIDFLCFFVSLSQLVLNGPQLFPQEEFPLHLGHLFLGLRLDLGLHLQDLQLFAQDFVEAFKALDGILNLEDFLGFVHAESEVGSNKVRQPSRVLDIIENNYQVWRQDFPIGDDLFELFLDRSHQGLNLKGDFRDRGFLDLFDTNHIVGPRLNVFLDLSLG